MPRHQISAKSKKVNIVTEMDAKRFRERALWHYRKPSKAERRFDHILENRVFDENDKRIEIDKKDFKNVMALLEEYWNLQEQIKDEENTDSQMQRAYIDQQNDILDELEIIYNKYLPVKKK